MIAFQAAKTSPPDEDDVMTTIIIAAAAALFLCCGVSYTTAAECRMPLWVYYLQELLFGVSLSVLPGIANRVSKRVLRGQMPNAVGSLLAGLVFI